MIPQETGTDHVRPKIMPRGSRKWSLKSFAREGTRLCLSVALEEEVTEFLKRRRYEHSGGNNRSITMDIGNDK